MTTSGLFVKTKLWPKGEEYNVLEPTSIKHISSSLEIQELSVIAL